MTKFITFKDHTTQTQSLSGAKTRLRNRTREAPSPPLAYPVLGLENPIVAVEPAVATGTVEEPGATPSADSAPELETVTAPPLFPEPDGGADPVVDEANVGDFKLPGGWHFSVGPGSATFAPGEGSGPTRRSGVVNIALAPGVDLTIAYSVSTPAGEEELRKESDSIDLPTPIDGAADDSAISQIGEASDNADQTK